MELASSLAKWNYIQRYYSDLRKMINQQKIFLTDFSKAVTAPNSIASFVRPVWTEFTVALSVEFTLEH